MSTAQALLCVASEGAVEAPARMGAQTCMVEQTVPLAQRTCTHNGLKPLFAISFPSSPWDVRAGSVISKELLWQMSSNVQDNIV